MKYHLNIILLAVRAMIIVTIVFTGIQLFKAYTTFLNPADFENTVREEFATISKELAISTEALPYFHILCAILWGYLVYILIILYRSFDRLQKGEIFYDKQAVAFKKAGEGIIIFAKCKYLLVCVFGVFFFRSLSVFIKEIPMFLVVYLLGKLVLVLYYLAEKGTFLKEETDLTI
ncbi:DUF2975 domain-containing protein [Flavobacterium salilacus subsp. salilacus]|uniref:DUF2975 domain-containing protein n=1 Tax=Flavobacterium TaxID=237 RepID=UPI0010752B74|nr:MULTISPECIES: DUF2975 domain-containing protein [Flavobacterium]KAF2518872.1 DUF2975 domain-containing protein [Flavobacterium salilacus subsp. salilacus]MBE1614968.1 DUF2975 domain-containing protein [Flavobacterium sp. SaA2.13]